ncbi:hypothetical protein PC119_g6265 [Phytophthora cactorum]|nr:hypothetical protein PC119_g6265 [Phytophthora cactorum]KAG3198334.1 hypothetical protein PC128_g6087 [Phytophthora cactorum]
MAPLARCTPATRATAWSPRSLKTLQILRTVPTQCSPSFQVSLARRLRRGPTSLRFGISLSGNTALRVAVVRAGESGVQGSSNWIIKNPRHNHVNNETLYTALKQCKDLLIESVMSMFDAFGQTNTDTKPIVSYVADTTGLPISTQQVRNLMNARLGHGSAEQRLKIVLAEFASTADNEGVLLQGDWDQSIDIVLQTKAQREIFSRWGDTLALNWTHNCTNLGFYVGKTRSCATAMQRCST